MLFLLLVCRMQCATTSKGGSYATFNRAEVKEDATYQVLDQ